MSLTGRPHRFPDTVDHIDQLTVADAADGLALSTEAGWNQIAADWTWLLGAGAGFGIRNTAGRVIATSLALPYPPDFGWVSLVLVHEPYRRRGLATRLMRRAVEVLRAANLVPMLDATPAGREVYATLGFADVEPINRWRGTGGVVVEDAPQAVDLAGIAKLDATAFGADRSGLLKAIAQRRDSRVIFDSGGYVLIRHGRTATQFGPVVADSTETSARLIDFAVRQTAGPVVIDVPQRVSGLSTALEGLGFVVERHLTRMAYGRSQNFGNPSLIAAIAGPELG